MHQGHEAGFTLVFPIGDAAYGGPQVVNVDPLNILGVIVELLFEIIETH